MGSLTRQPIRRWRERYDLMCLVQTGYGDGAGVQAALDAGFFHIQTIEVLPERIVAGAEAFNRYGVSFIMGDSARVLPDVIPGVVGPALWWLDAHLPELYGPAAGITPLPLEAELAALTRGRGGLAQDAILIDDARIYQDGGWEAGDLPAEMRERYPATGLAWILDGLAPTHVVSVDPRDQGYVVALPKR